MYREVRGVKEPTPSAADVEQFSLGQEADPSLSGTGSQEPPGSRNPLSLLLRRNG
jgi:starch synthase